MITTAFGYDTFTMIGPDHISHWHDTDYQAALALAEELEEARGGDMRKMGHWHLTWHDRAHRVA